MYPDCRMIKMMREAKAMSKWVGRKAPHRRCHHQIRIRIRTLWSCAYSTQVRRVEGHHAICGKAFADHFHGSELRILLRRKPSNGSKQARSPLRLD